MLYVILLGGKHPRAKLELHDIVFARAERLEETYDQLRAAWFGAPEEPHIDGWMELEGIDGYRIEWSAENPAPGEPRLFFVHLGGYEKGIFGEAHRHLLTVASDRATAKRQAKQQLGKIWLRPHTDALFEVDGCIPIETIDGLHLRLVPGAHNDPTVVSDYLTLG